MPGASASALGPAALRLSGQSSSGSVLLVSNLNEEVYSEIVNLSCSIDLLLKKMRISFSILVVALLCILFYVNFLKF